MITALEKSTIQKKNFLLTICLAYMLLASGLFALVGVGVSGSDPVLSAESPISTIPPHPRTPSPGGTALVAAAAVIGGVLA